MTAPNVVHFIYPVTERTRPFSALNLLAVKRARAIQTDAKIRFWTNVEPREIDHWEELSTLVDFVREEMPEGEYPQYQSDTLRLSILYEDGGIYMDTDLLLMRPLHSLLTGRLVFSWESAKKESICNAFMISPPGNRFIAEWMRRLPEAQKSPVWAYGGVVLPALMLQDPALARHTYVMHHTTACPLDLSRPWLTDPDLWAHAEITVKVGNAYGVHCFETYWKDHWPGWQERPCFLRDLQI